MLDVLEFAFRSFWHFAGCFLLFCVAASVVVVVVKVPVVIVVRLCRLFAIRKHGWPPAHCDADGDFDHQNPACLYPNPPPRPPRAHF